MAHLLVVELIQQKLSINVNEVNIKSFKSNKTPKTQQKSDQIKYKFEQLKHEFKRRIQEMGKVGGITCLKDKECLFHFA